MACRGKGGGLEHRIIRGSGIIKGIPGESHPSSSRRAVSRRPRRADVSAYGVEGIVKPVSLLSFRVMYSGLFDSREDPATTRTRARRSGRPRGNRASRHARVDNKSHASSTRNARLTVIMSSVECIGRERSGDSRANFLALLTILEVPTRSCSRSLIATR